MPTPAFVATLGGPAVLEVLQAASVAAFGTRFALSVLTTFVVTVSGITVLDIGGPFRGLVAGVGVALLVEPGDLAHRRQSETPPRAPAVVDPTAPPGTSAPS